MHKSGDKRYTLRFTYKYGKTSEAEYATEQIALESAQRIFEEASLYNIAEIKMVIYEVTETIVELKPEICVSSTTILL